MSAVIFNTLIIVALIPLALRGIKYRASGHISRCCAITSSSTGWAASWVRSWGSSSSISSLVVLHLT